MGKTFNKGDIPSAGDFNGFVQGSDLSATTGSAAVGSDDGASGSLWTTVAGFIAKIISSAGASVVGFLPSGTGAVATTVQDQLRSLFTVASNYASIQQAITAAGASGSVLIPASYAGTDTYTNPNNIPIFDLRNQHFGVWSWIEPGRSVSGIPFGNDFVLRANGPADLYLEKTIVGTTTTATLSAGANTNILVGAVTQSNGLRGTMTTGTTALFCTGANIVVGRGTANEETVVSGSYSVVDGTHITLTCAKSHSGTTTIEQVGTTFLATPSLTVNSNKLAAAGLSYKPQLQLNDSTNTNIALIPSDLTASYPYSLWQQAAIFAGLNGPNQDLLFQCSLAASMFRWRNNLGQTIVTLDNNGSFVAGGYIQSTGPLAGIGYVSPAGGAATQATSKSTAVTLSKITGQITTAADALASNAVVSFVLTNGAIAANTDIVHVVLVSGNATPATYQVWSEGATSGSARICIRNISGGSLSEALVLQFAVLKGANS